MKTTLVSENTITESKVVKEYKYTSSDGKDFSDKLKCLKHEVELMTVSKDFEFKFGYSDFEKIYKITSEEEYNDLFEYYQMDYALFIHCPNTWKNIKKSVADLYTVAVYEDSGSVRSDLEVQPIEDIIEKINKRIDGFNSLKSEALRCVLNMKKDGKK